VFARNLTATKREVHNQIKRSLQQQHPNLFHSSFANTTVSNRHSGFKNWQTTQRTHNHIHKIKSPAMHACMFLNVHIKRPIHIWIVLLRCTIIHHGCVIRVGTNSIHVRGSWNDRLWLWLLGLLLLHRMNKLRC
jgi:hypothetical protein